MAQPSSKKRPPADPDLAIKPINPYLDFILRFLLFLELARQIYYCYTTRQSNPNQLLNFGICFVITIIAIYLSKKIFKSLGKYLSSLKPDDPLSNEITLHKFEDQGWQWVIHVTMSLCELYLLSYGDGHKWWNDFKSIGCPGEYAITWEIENFVLLQLAIWLVTGFSCTFFEARRKDYLEMMIHHILTNLLIGTAIVNGEHAFALLILWVHDSSDVLVDTLKLSNYLKLEDSQYCYISEICFVTLVYGVWPYCRMYMYPKIVLEGEFEGYQEKCMGDASPGTSTYDLTVVPTWISFRCFLCMLLCGLHWFWWILFNKIAFSIVKGGKKGSEAGNEHVEGDDGRKKK
jgi:ceramide synthetase